MLFRWHCLPPGRALPILPPPVFISHFNNWFRAVHGTRVSPSSFSLKQTKLTQYRGDPSLSLPTPAARTVGRAWSLPGWMLAFPTPVFITARVHGSLPPHTRVHVFHGILGPTARSIRRSPAPPTQRISGRRPFLATPLARHARVACLASSHVFVVEMLPWAMWTVHIKCALSLLSEVG